MRCGRPLRWPERAQKTLANVAMQADPMLVRTPVSTRSRASWEAQVVALSLKLVAAERLARCLQEAREVRLKAAREQADKVAPKRLRNA